MRGTAASIRSNLAETAAQRRPPKLYELRRAAPTVCLSILIEVAEAIEARLQVLGARALLLANAGARHESAPSEMGPAVARPSWAAIATSEPSVGVGLYERNASVNLAARSFAFDICARISLLKSEILRQGREGGGKSCECCQNDGFSDELWHA